MKKLIVAIVLAATASVFASFSYQGALRLADGTPVEGGPKAITFSLYSGPADANPLWVGRQAVVVSPTNGLFNVEISDSTPNPTSEARALLDDLFAAHDSLYIGIFVEGSTGEIRPRQRILPVPTASFAKNVSKAQCDMIVMSNLFVQGAAEVKGKMTIRHGVEVDGSVTFHDGATIAGSVSVGGSLSTSVGGKPVEVMPVPIGGIIMWSQKTAPDGENWATDANEGHWAICNGDKVNGVQTPDLRGRFIVGASPNKDKGNGVNVAYAAGETGGTNAVALKTSEMPAHFHLYPGDEDWMYLFKGGDRFGKWGENDMRYRLGRTYLHNHEIGQHPDFDMDGKGSNKLRILETGRTGGDGTKTTNEDSEGEGYAALDHAAAHENRPPYYALFYIMRVK